MLIRLVFTEIEPFENVKIYKEMYGNPDADPIIYRLYLDLHGLKPGNISIPDSAAFSFTYFKRDNAMFFSDEAPSYQVYQNILIEYHYFDNSYFDILLIFIEW